MLMQNFGVTNKEHYDMLWYFLGWSILCEQERRCPFSPKIVCTAPIRSVYSRTSHMYLLPFNSAISHYI